jgi:tRNA (adenine57-N1/adenine58-N1)-methyltransferase
MMLAKTSPLLFPGPVSSVDALSIVHLKRDLQVPTILKQYDEDDEGYIPRTKSSTRDLDPFQHPTLIGLPWGSQVRASKVDMGCGGQGGTRRGNSVL